VVVKLALVKCAVNRLGGPLVLLDTSEKYRQALRSMNGTFVEECLLLKPHGMDIVKYV
jgi:hypothetical protein